MKIVKLLLYLCILCSAANLNATVIGLRIPDTTAIVGDTINIPVYADSSLTGENVYSYQLQISFDAELLYAHSVLIDGTISESFGSPAFNNSVSGQVTIAGAGITPLSGSGVFLYIRFIPLQSGFSSILFTGSENNFFNEGAPGIVFDNGSICIPSSIYEFQNNSSDFILYQNYPNPFSSSTTISFDSRTNLYGFAWIKIYNIKGQLIKVLSTKVGKGTGIHIVEWDGTDNQGIQVSNGMYFYRIESVRQLDYEMKKLILMR
ncbi:T9SS C-terminal target domain-containing protein [bacterium]|nr:MAG: T9SS C-terminal target domain-containing protein [bacterium]